MIPGEITAGVFIGLYNLFCQVRILPEQFIKPFTLTVFLRHCSRQLRRPHFCQILQHFPSVLSRIIRQPPLNGFLCNSGKNFSKFPHPGSHVDQRRQGIITNKCPDFFQPTILKPGRKVIRHLLNMWGKFITQLSADFINGRTQNITEI
ncbi:hypothetical protein C3986_00598 [Escherichia coli]|nr:hypothetical protein C3986_00598 [Escherichia coli]